MRITTSSAAMIAMLVVLAAACPGLAGAGNPVQAPKPVNSRSATCPLETATTVGEKVFRIRDLEGKRLWRAKAIAQRHDCTIRVVWINGQPLAVTEDFISNRINVRIRGSKANGWRVVRADGVG